MGAFPPIPVPAAPRIALYSHDTQGLGHVRRNLLIAAALSRGCSAATILLLSGIREAAAFAMPAGVDCMTLPSLGKGVNGQYFPRSLGVSTNELLHVRRKSLMAALASFDPDVLIVDKVPAGACEELLPSLAALRARGRARLVLGLREILDDPEIVRREWSDGAFDRTVRTYYRQIWVYGDRSVFDPVASYGFPPDIATMVRYTGYLNSRDTHASDRRIGGGDQQRKVRQLDSMGGPLVVCLVGGGQDGLPLAESFLRAELPPDHRGTLVTGPMMPEPARVRLKTLAATHSRMEMFEFVTDPCPLLERADRVIAMGGYNTVCEVLAYDKRALIVPRVTPRTEQLIRARRFAELGLLDMLHPDELTPAALSRWIGREPAPVTDRGAIDFDGVMRLPALLDDLLAHRPDQEPSHAVACR